MASVSLELKDRVVLDTGEVINLLDRLLDQAIAGESLTHLKVWARTPEEIHEINQYNQFMGEPTVSFWEPSDPEKPPESSYTWQIPAAYRDLDVEEYVIEKFASRDLVDKHKYVDRLAEELDEFERRGMFDFLRTLIYVYDRFVAEKVVWGVGRGSSCACLILFLIGINRVDPVKYNIPLKEFLK